MPIKLTSATHDCNQGAEETLFEMTYFESRNTLSNKTHNCTLKSYDENNSSHMISNLECHSFRFFATKSRTKIYRKKHIAILKGAGTEGRYERGEEPEMKIVQKYYHESFLLMQLFQIVSSYCSFPILSKIKTKWHTNCTALHMIFYVSYTACMYDKEQWRIGLMTKGLEIIVSNF